jgi:hypothetical protein
MREGQRRMGISSLMTGVTVGLGATYWGLNFHTPLYFASFLPVLSNQRHYSAVKLRKVLNLNIISITADGTWIIPLAAVLISGQNCDYG